MIKADTKSTFRLLVTLTILVVAYVIWDQGLHKKKITLQTAEGTVEGEITNEKKSKKS